MPSKTRHMSFPLSKRAPYENHTAIRAHRLGTMTGRDATFTRDSRPGPSLDHAYPPRTTPNLDPKLLPSRNMMRERRSFSQSWAKRESHSNRSSHSRGRRQRSMSQTWSKREHPTSIKPLPQSWRNLYDCTTPQFRPQLSPIPGITELEKQDEVYENHTALSSPATLGREDEFSSSEYVNFSPSRSPVFPISEELVQPYLDCMPSESHLNVNPYDMQEDLQAEEEDSFVTDDSFETVSDIYEADNEGKGDHPYDLDSQLSEQDGHMYEKIPE